MIRRQLCKNKKGMDELFPDNTRSTETAEINLLLVVCKLLHHSMTWIQQKMTNGMGRESSSLG